MRVKSESDKESSAGSTWLFMADRTDGNSHPRCALVRILLPSGVSSQCPFLSVFFALCPDVRDIQLVMTPAARSRMRVSIDDEKSSGKWMGLVA